MGGEREGIAIQEKLNSYTTFENLLNLIINFKKLDNLISFNNYLICKHVKKKSDHAMNKNLKRANSHILMRKKKNRTILESNLAISP